MNGKSNKGMADNVRSRNKALAMVAKAQEKLTEGDLEAAWKAGRKALGLLQDGEKEGQVETLPALTLLADIAVEKGDVEEAASLFELAVELDPEGLIPEYAGGGAEKFLWLAQLSEEGGEESVEWFERGCEVLRRQIAMLDGQGGSMEEKHTPLQEKRQKLAQALCGIVEIYMTDLSYETGAEEKCERAIAEAMMVAPPDSPEVLQTLANVRISQDRIEEAKKALKASLGVWKEDPELDDRTPDFPTRISLARLLMEVELLQEALTVVDRLVQEDDQSVEAWYLGGWCLHLLGSDGKHVDLDGKTARGHMNGNSKPHKPNHDVLSASRIWLKQSLELYDSCDYEDERLQEHAQELVEQLDFVLGAEAGNDSADEGMEVEEVDEWEWNSEDDRAHQAYEEVE
ncbi:uncharacterized protein KY384_009253 [Bacidia gigantensis]|uniref:uncharacterized protein n=1 Tax=Bacidia gigantensis TaxID=2732470 RepID=UPI001D037EDC|nr:uncharacterized protein KY384_009253 [Bacidia gigantensis]KAG8525609.1 hypothetical protein KY384_009253 [Bacidia gigantensis]